MSAVSNHEHPCAQCSGPVKNYKASICRGCYIGSQTAETKTCAVCKTPKPLGAFKPRPAYRFGVNSVCRACDAKARRDLYHRDVGRAREKSRVSMLKSQYGLTPEQHAEMAGSGCHICGGQCPTGRRLAVDHCHATGKVRGVLCANCNRALGLFGDNAALMAKAIEYLKTRG